MGKLVLLGFACGVFALGAKHAWAQETGTGSFGMECLVEENHPTKNKCAGRFGIRRSSALMMDEFVLALNDPIEYFLYESRYALLADFAQMQTLYWRPPILGGIRDRFINADPFDDTLLFTVVASELGYVWRWGPISIGADAGLIYVKQRYAPNFVHTNREQNPELNKRFAFAQFGAGRQVYFQLDIEERLRIDAALSIISLPHHGDIYSESEESLRTMLTLRKGDDVKLGLSLQAYRRLHALRKDGHSERFLNTRAGVWLEF